MKLKALLLACAVAGAGASFALADDGHGKHHEHGSTTTGTTATTTTGTTTTGTTTTTTAPDAHCSRVELRGTLASVSAQSFTLTVKKADARGDDDDNDAAADALVGQTVTIGVDARTRVRWDGTGTLIGPNVGDRARVSARSCGTPAALTARQVRADGPHAAKHGDGHDGSKSHK